jgi:hypothetical protein
LHDSGQSLNHFWLSWSTIGCGGFITKNNTNISALTSDFVNANLSESRECRWEVKAPIDLVPKIYIKSLYTEGNVNTSDKQCIREKDHPEKFSGLEVCLYF